MPTVTLAIQGMSCNHCVMQVHKALAEVPGVQQATVTLDPGQARIDYDENTATAETMAAAVKKAGYAATAVG